MIGLSLWIVGEGVTAMKKAAAVPNDKKPCQKAEKTEKRRWVVIALILCALYYAALAFIKSSVCDHRNFIFCVHIFDI